MALHKAWCIFSAAFISIFVAAIVMIATPELRELLRNHDLLISGILSIMMAIVVSCAEFIDKITREKKIEIVEERLREHPEKPQLAWDLARTKLENYLDRNLSQVRSIYWLTLMVMFCGFGFILFGLFQASQNPEKLPVSIVASASGVVISFIGGSFLLIYRSILAQSKEYVTVLERINAVGMAVQVIASIPDSDGQLKNSTTAELAKQLLNLYAVVPVARGADEPSKSQIQSAA
ncbi:TRADD-N-associated membrane domain-containing protein [Candidatus Electronema sp. PJ]|uniref:TRADD-N-associated membrane domain-containing protein n=1 Tax=Candidatus Electronema sp. PJ TaxID=3401572 RepID=UPI003AA94BE1